MFVLFVPARLWDDSRCQCGCRLDEVMECTSGMPFDAAAANSCSCVPDSGAIRPDAHRPLTTTLLGEGQLFDTVQSETEAIIIGILLALVLVLALTSLALCLHIQALKQRRRRRPSGRFDLRPDEEEDILRGQVVPRGRRPEEEEEEVCRYSEASCSTPSSGFQSDSLDSREAVAAAAVAEQAVHLLDPAAAQQCGLNQDYAAMPRALRSPRMTAGCHRHAGGACLADGEAQRQAGRSPDTHLDEALRLLQMTTNNLERNQ
jgi:hypothetical protein